jgi:hypothetical protein
MVDTYFFEISVVGILGTKKAKRTLEFAYDSIFR